MTSSEGIWSAVGCSADSGNVASAVSADVTSELGTLASPSGVVGTIVTSSASISSGTV